MSKLIEKILWKYRKDSTYSVAEAREDIESLFQEERERIKKKVLKLKAEHGEFCSRDHYYGEFLDYVLKLLEEQK